MDYDLSQEQIGEISNLLLEYSAGNYAYQGKISDQVNELDMIISGINMLGEELESTNVSRDYFSSIFNAVTDLVLVVDEDGIISDINSTAEEALGIAAEELNNYKYVDIITEPEFDKIKNGLINGRNSFVTEAEVNGSDNNVIFGLFACSKMIDRFDNFKGYLIIIKDITEQKEHEKLILQTIFTTQQHEQKRVADDLHDSIGQELSMTKLMMSNLKALCENDPKKLELIKISTDILDNSINGLRQICFNLMPNVLAKGGLELAITDLLEKLEASNELDVAYSKNQEIPKLDPDLEIVIYRIIQEFINNMIKHAKASLLTIDVRISKSPSKVEITLKDNGVGFDMKKLGKVRESRGYYNLESKVKAFNGKLFMQSSPGEGTMTKVNFPYNPQ